MNSTLRERRQALGLSQEQLAAALGVRRLTIIRLERAAELPRVYDLAMEALEKRHARSGSIEAPAAA